MMVQTQYVPKFPEQPLKNDSLVRYSEPQLDVKIPEYSDVFHGDLAPVASNNP